MSRPRYSIIPGDFAEDSRADVGHFRVINLVGRHTDENGWCRLKQLTIGDNIGLTRETVCKKIRDLVTWGYIEKHSEDATGRAIWYRTIMDRAWRPQRPAIDTSDDDDCDSVDRETIAGPVNGGSHVGYNSDSQNGVELYPTCDATLTPGVNAANHTRCERIASQHNDSFLTTEGSTPNPIREYANGGQAEFDDLKGAGLTGKSFTADEAIAKQATLLADLRRESLPGDAVERLLAPILTTLRFSATDKPGDLRSLALEAKALPGPALDRAARLVLDAKVATVKTSRIRDAIAVVRVGGAMFVIKRGTPQWTRWGEHLERTDAKQAALMARFDVWQVRAEWPPQAGGANANANGSEVAA